MATVNSRIEANANSTLGPRKTLIIVVTVVGCIAILWPKVFYPMMVGPGQTKNIVKDHRGPGCCDVVLDQESFANMTINYTNQQNLFRKRNIGPVIEDTSIRQERPPHLRPESMHPAMRERGRAIPQTGSVHSERTHSPPRIVEGRPGPIPGMRPPMGAGSHQSTKSANSMGFIMPLYTIGIVSFFIYTILKLIFKKTPNAPYPEIKPDPAFRNEVFTTDQYIKRPDSGNTKLGQQPITSAENGVPVTVHPAVNGLSVQAEISVDYEQLAAKSERPSTADSQEATPEVLVATVQERTDTKEQQVVANDSEHVPPSYDPATDTQVVDGSVAEVVEKIDDTLAETAYDEKVEVPASQVVTENVQQLEEEANQEAEAAAVEMVEQVVAQAEATVNTVDMIESQPVSKPEYEEESKQMEEALDIDVRGSFEHEKEAVTDEEIMLKKMQAESESQTNEILRSSENIGEDTVTEEELAEETMLKKMQAESASETTEELKSSENLEEDAVNEEELAIKKQQESIVSEAGDDIINLQIEQKDDSVTDEELALKNRQEQLNVEAKNEIESSVGLVDSAVPEEHVMERIESEQVTTISEEDAIKVMVKSHSEEESAPVEIKRVAAVSFEDEELPESAETPYLAEEQAIKELAAKMETAVAEQAKEAEIRAIAEDLVTEVLEQAEEIANEKVSDEVCTLPSKESVDQKLVDDHVIECSYEEPVVEEIVQTVAFENCYAICSKDLSNGNDISVEECRPTVNASEDNIRSEDKREDDTQINSVPTDEGLLSYDPSTQNLVDGIIVERFDSKDSGVSESTQPEVLQSETVESVVAPLAECCVPDKQLIAENESATVELISDTVEKPALEGIKDSVCETENKSLEVTVDALESTPSVETLKDISKDTTTMETVPDILEASLLASDGFPLTPKHGEKFPVGKDKLAEVTKIINAEESFLVRMVNDHATIHNVQKKLEVEIMELSNKKPEESSNEKVLPKEFPKKDLSKVNVNAFAVTNGAASQDDIHLSKPVSTNLEVTTSEKEVSADIIESAKSNGPEVEASETIFEEKDGKNKLDGVSDSISAQTELPISDTMEQQKDSGTETKRDAAVTNENVEVVAAIISQDALELHEPEYKTEAKDFSNELEQGEVSKDFIEVSNDNVEQAILEPTVTVETSTAENKEIKTDQNDFAPVETNVISESKSIDELASESVGSAICTDDILTETVLETESEPMLEPSASETLQVCPESEVKSATNNEIDHTSDAKVNEVVAAEPKIEGQLPLSPSENCEVVVEVSDKIIKPTVEPEMKDSPSSMPNEQSSVESTPVVQIEKTIDIDCQQAEDVPTSKDKFLDEHVLVVQTDEPIELECSQTEVVDKIESAVSETPVTELQNLTESVGPIQEEIVTAPEEAKDTSVSSSAEEVTIEQKSDEVLVISDDIITTELIDDRCSNEPVIINGDSTTVEAVTINDTVEEPQQTPDQPSLKLPVCGPHIEEVHDDESVNVTKDEGTMSEEFVIKIEVEKSDTSAMISEVVDEPTAVSADACRTASETSPITVTAVLDIISEKQEEGASGTDGEIAAEQETEEPSSYREPSTAAVEKSAETNGHIIESVDSCSGDTEIAEPVQKDQTESTPEEQKSEAKIEKQIDTGAVPKKLDDSPAVKMIPMEKKVAYEASSRPVSPVQSIVLDSSTTEVDAKEQKCILLDPKVPITSKVHVADSDLAVETLENSQKSGEETPFDLNLIVVFESVSALNQGRSVELNVLLGSEPTTTVVRPSVAARVASPTREVVLSGKMKLSLVKLDDNEKKAADDQSKSKDDDSSGRKKGVPEDSLGPNEE